METLVNDYPIAAEEATEKFWDIVLDTEATDSSDFMEVCGKLVDDLNDYIEQVRNNEASWERLISGEDGLEL